MGKTFCHGILKLSQKSSDDSILEEEDELAVSNGVPLMEDSSQGDGDSDDEEKLIEGSNTSRRYTYMHCNNIHQSIINCIHDPQ